MSPQDRRRLHDLMSRVLGIGVFEAASANALDVPQWDSLAHLSLVAAVEEEFGVRFPTERIAELDSTSAIACAIEEAA